MCSGGAGAQLRLKADSGRYVIRIRDTDFAADTFTADAEGGSESEISFARGSTRGALHLSVRAYAGQVNSFDATAATGSRFLLALDGATPQLGQGETGPTTLPMKDVRIPRRLFPYCTTAPEQFRPLLAAYNRRIGGPQTFDVAYSNTLSPSGLILGRITLAPIGTRAVYIGGKTIPVVRYRVSVPTSAGSVDGEVSADSDGRVLLYRLPSQQLIAVRDGFQELAGPSPPEDPSLSAASYSVKVERNVRTPMRDGVTLAADVYRPDAPGKFPVILERTCYGRAQSSDARYFAQRGYVFVAQDVRGKFDSGGEWRPWINEAGDGNDTLEWCARQRWSNGKIGTIGEGYPAFTQWAAARERNPHLKCLIPIVSPTEPFYSVPYRYGALTLFETVRWSALVEGAGIQTAERQSKLEAFKTLPVTDADKAIYGHSIAFLQDWMRYPQNDSYWESANFNDRMPAIPDLPTLHVGGWFDGAAIGTMRNYSAMTDSRHRNQKLIVGPWSHTVNAGTKLGSRDFGPGAALDLQPVYLRWFDRWLKGFKNGIEQEPMVNAFLLGSDVWRRYSTWPPKETRPLRWRLHSAGHANSDQSDGTLSLEAPKGLEPSDHFAYDPMRPFIPASAHNADYAERETLDLLPPTGDHDVLAYTSAPMPEDTIVAGPVSLHLTAETSAPDTDWYAGLLDVGPDGNAVFLTDGIVRARFRKSLAAPSLLKPREVAQYAIDMSAIGCVFKKGHRIRLVVTSSCFPIYAGSLNSGADSLTTTRAIIAQQTIHHSSAHPSYIVLPMLRK